MAVIRRRNSMLAAGAAVLAAAALMPAVADATVTVSVKNKGTALTATSDKATGSFHVYNRGSKVRFVSGAAETFKSSSCEITTGGKVAICTVDRLKIGGTFKINAAASAGLRVRLRGLAFLRKWTLSMVGGAGRDELNTTGGSYRLRSVTFDGAGGNDVVTLRNMNQLNDPDRRLVESSKLIGGPGSDRLIGLHGNIVTPVGQPQIGHDEIDGGIGNDEVAGLTGGDSVVGGAGVDRILMDDGNDLIDSLDNAADAIVRCQLAAGTADTQWSRDQQDLAVGKNCPTQSNIPK